MIRRLLNAATASRAHRPPAERLIKHYQAQLQAYGPTHQAVQWSSVDAQQRRFRVLSAVVEPHDTVVDVGCGVGDLLTFLRGNAGFRGNYLGLDFVPEFIAHCRKRYADDEGAEFRTFNLWSDPFPAGYDCFLTSGTFNNRVSEAEDHLTWMRLAIASMFASARKVAAFNSLSSHVDRLESNLFYTRPEEMLEWCARHLTRRFTLRHDYNIPPQLGLPIDYTMFLFKD